MLGDWYANLLYTKHVRLVICASERSLLPVFVEEEPATLRSEFAKQCHQLWERIGVETACIDRELHEMSQVVFGATSSRRVLGSLNELAFLSRESIKEPVKVDLIDLAVSLNASDGLELFRTLQPQLVTLDLLMPKVGEIDAKACSVRFARKTPKSPSS